ncbi:MAG: hypothetical protein AAF718_13000 [Pseudomonadota bacterium]
MVDGLTQQDWQRIVFALSQFTHNAEFRETLARVSQFLDSPKE